jgi:hypothetical protein
MQINSKILSIPPHISTAWTNVSSLHIEENGNQKALVVHLTNSSKIKLPNLPQHLIDSIFEAHASFLEESTPKNNTQDKKNLNPFNGDTLLLNLPFKLDGLSMDHLTSFMQHNGEQKDMPNMPKELLSKILEVAKMMGMDELKNLPKPEPHCNCTHCQVIRAISNSEEEQEEEAAGEEEESVLDEELTFKNWDISQKSEKLFTVTNPLDKSEAYQVFLGEPIGCTCGQKNCEHIEAVLRT